MKSLLIKLEGLALPQAKALLKRLGARGICHWVSTKYDTELLFQQQWVKEFKENQEAVLQYWKKYRYLDEINKVCRFTHDTTVLDVGCGISTVLHYVTGIRLGIDPLADEYLKLYKYPDGIQAMKGFGEDIPFVDEYFDVVFCSNALDHTTDPGKVVEEIFRALKNGGYFILTVEIFDFTSKKERNLAHPHSLEKEDVYSLIKSKFKIMFENESPWIGLRAYVKGSREASSKELIMILKKEFGEPST